MTTRWNVLITAILIVFAGRLVLNLLVFKAGRPITAGSEASRRPPARFP